jgi:hypothetical protein
MTTHSSYFMRDQVNNLVPSLMDLSVQGARKQRGRVLELAVFVATTAGYLIALGLTA